jgi:integrase
MSLFKRGGTWWYEFWFAGRRIQESTKSTSKVVARGAEQRRRRELEEGFNNFEDVRHERVRTIRDVGNDLLASYRLRNPQSATFAAYAVGHVQRLLGDRMLVEVGEQTVKEFQDQRLQEKAAPKTINEEVGFLLRLLGDVGDVLRMRLRKKKLLKLKVRNRIGKAYDPAEKGRLLATAKLARSPHIFPALMLAMNTGMRGAEMRNLTWGQIDLTKRYLAVGRSKTEAGEGRTIPLNSALHAALVEYAEWYKERFGEVQPEWYIFPFGKPRPNDPTRPVTTLKTAWRNLRTNANVTGRWHDNRHTLVTDLAEKGASDQTIMDIAGHVSKQMLKHYSHVRMEAKRAALESILDKPNPDKPNNEKPDNAAPTVQIDSAPPTSARHLEGESLQKSLQSPGNCGRKRDRRADKLLNRFGSSGRTRTYNPSVNRTRIYALSETYAEWSAT